MSKSAYIKIIAVITILVMGVLLYFYFMEVNGDSNYTVLASNQLSVEIDDPVFVNQVKTGKIVGVNNMLQNNLIAISVQLQENINITESSKLDVFPNVDSSELYINIELLPSYNYFHRGDTLVMEDVDIAVIEKKIAKTVDPATDSITNSTTQIKEEAEVVERVEKTKKNDVQLQVQVLVSSQQFAIDSKKFFGLIGIHFIREGDLNKYFYGKPNSFDEALQLQKKAKEAGLKDAFVVAYQNGKRISIKEARTLVK